MRSIRIINNKKERDYTDKERNPFIKGICSCVHVV